MSERITAGARLGPYEIVGWLGAGGMGEVYRARDPRLGRDVAIKLIHDAVSADAGRIHRFEQEARAAGQLSHPSITAVYDVGMYQGVPYIVSELLEGESLRQRLQKGALPVRKAIAYAREAADALAAAHERGIVHRDVKPDNLFITNDGRLKILDFGIAKLASSAHEDGQRTGVPTDTAAGTVVGTAAYMSPEQIRGEALDSRSDIFSLGVVIHEMLSGRAAFARGTTADTMAAILKEELPEIELQKVSPTLARTIARCVEKARESRFQSARDLAFGLDMVTGTTATPPAVRRPLRWQSVLLPAAMVVSLAIAAGSWMRDRSAPAFDPLADATFSRITGWPGDEGGAQISPDGRFVAFVADRAGRYDVWTSQIGSGMFRNLTADGPASPPPSGVLRLSGFSADGSQIWRSVGDEVTVRRRQYLMPFGGGSPRLFLGERDRAPAWSPDGSRLAYMTGSEGDPLWVAGPMGADPQQVLIDPPGLHNHNPTWSIDGAWIYFVHGRDPAIGMNVWRVRPDGSGREQLTFLDTDATFLAAIDAQTVLFTARAPDMSGPWLWAADVARKITRRVSAGLEIYASVAASHDGSRIVATVAQPKAALWTVPVLADRPATDADVQPYAINASSPFAPRLAGSSLYFLNEQGTSNGLWRLDAGKEPEQVWSGLDGGLAEPAAVSRDGRRVAIVLREGGRRRLVSIAPDGTNPRTISGSIAILGTPRRSAADWSPDGEWIVTGGDDGSGEGLFKIPANGGPPVRILTGQAQNPVWSPDGRFIVYSSAVVEGRAQLQAIRPDGTAWPFPQLQSGPGAYRFTPDGTKLIFIPILGARNFHSLDLASRKTTPLTSISAKGEVVTFDLMPDDHIVFERIVQSTDIVLIERPKMPRRQ